MPCVTEAVKPAERTPLRSSPLPALCGPRGAGEAAWLAPGRPKAGRSDAAKDDLPRKAKDDLPREERAEVAKLLMNLVKRDLLPLFRAASRLRSLQRWEPRWACADCHYMHLCAVESGQWAA